MFKNLLLCSAFVTASAFGQMKIHFINVGQAASALLEFPNSAVLIDAGGEDSAPDKNRDAKALQAHLTKFFQSRPDLKKTLDAVIVSHPHMDHTKNLMTVMKKFQVRALVENGDQNAHASGMGPLQQARDFMKTAHTKLIAVPDPANAPNGNRLHLLQMEGDPETPEIVILSSLRGCDNANNDSVGVHVKYKAASALFIGDAENVGGPVATCPPLLNTLLDRYSQGSLLKSDVMHVAHHGSPNGTLPEFMQAVAPRISVISAGSPDQKTPGRFHAFFFGHPRTDAVSIVEANTSGDRDTPKTVAVMPESGVHNPNTAPVNQNMAKAVYCTCWDGDIVVAFDREGLNPVVTIQH